MKWVILMAQTQNTSINPAYIVNLEALYGRMCTRIKDATPLSLFW